MSIDSSAATRWTISRVELFLLLLANVNLLSCSLYAAMHSSPTLDEPAHFASGFVLGTTSDTGYFKVNPPLNKWVTGLVAPLMNIELPPLVASRAYSNATRPEFDLGDTLLELNRESYLSALTIARLARIPFLLLGSWMLWQVVAGCVPSCRVLAVSGWCCSPLVLGHGWIVSADALAGVAMCCILLTSKWLIEQPNWKSYALSGLAWGLAIGTKFTFAPLVVATIPIIELCLLAKSWPNNYSRSRSRQTSATWFRDSFRWDKSRWHAGKWLLPVIGRWTLQAAVACLTVNGLYLFQDTGVSLAQHDFISHEFSSVDRHAAHAPNSVGKVVQALAWLPSPLPRAFLEGIDQQLADMNAPRGAYLLGTRLEGQLPWFFLVGYWLKEQMAVPLAVVLIIGAALLRCVRRRANREQVPELPWQLFCLLSLVAFCMLMATQSNLVWNMRYLIPALPLIYVLLAVWLPPLNFSTRMPARLGGLNVSCVLLCSVMLVECLRVAPFHFSYINPLFGGSYRVPIALNDSNVDYGQDLFYVRAWAEQFQKQGKNQPSLQLFGILSGHGRVWLKDVCPPASPQMVDAALAHARQRAAGTGAAWEPRGKLLVVSRGLTHPEPWAVRYSTLRDQSFDLVAQEQLEELLQLPPDVFITPMIAGYYLADFESLRSIPNVDGR